MHFICKHDSLKTFNLLSKVLKVNLMILVVKKTQTWKCGICYQISYKDLKYHVTIALWPASRLTDWSESRGDNNAFIQHLKCFLLRSFVLTTYRHTGNDCRDSKYDLFYCDFVMYIVVTGNNCLKRYEKWALKRIIANMLLRNIKGKPLVQFWLTVDFGCQ